MIVAGGITFCSRGEVAFVTEDSSRSLNGTVRAVAVGEICGGRLRLVTGGKQNFRIKVFMEWPPEGKAR